MFITYQVNTEFHLLDSELLPEAATFLDSEHRGGEGSREGMLAYKAQPRRLHARFSRLNETVYVSFACSQRVGNLGEKEVERI